MTYVRRLVFAIIILAFLICAWYGAEMLIHGESQRSVVDIAVAIMISLSISGRLEKGVEKSERKQEFAERFAGDFIEFLKTRTESQSGEDGSGKAD